MSKSLLGAGMTDFYGLMLNAADDPCFTGVTESPFGVKSVFIASSNSISAEATTDPRTMRSLGVTALSTDKIS
jgi:hypothetical protein